jgi:sucrose phosphorylase
VERTGLTRAVNRRQWDRGELEGLMADPGSETGRVFNAYRRLLRIRKAQKAFHPSAEQAVLDLDNGLFGLQRVSLDGGQKIICVFNCTACSAGIERRRLPQDIDQWSELIGTAKVEFSPERLVLPPYAACWFSNMPARS